MSANYVFSDYLDGWVPTNVGRVFPNRPAGYARSGPGSFFPVSLSREWVSFIWWRVKTWQIAVQFSTVIHTNGVTSNGNSWAYTETINGIINTTYDLNTPSDLVTNTGFFTGAISSIGANEFALGVKSFQKTGTVTDIYAWDFPPPPDAPTLPTSGNSTIVAEYAYFFDVAANGYTASVVSNANAFLGSFEVVIQGLGDSINIPNSNGAVVTNIEIQDAGGNSIGSIPLFSIATPLPNSAGGNIKIAAIW